MIQEIEYFKKMIYSLMDSHRYDEAKLILFGELERLQNTESQEYFFVAEIAGFLTDIGAENMDAEAAEAGAFLFESNAKLFSTLMTEESYFYNLANAKESLFKIRKYGVGLPSPGRIKPELIAAKNYFYRAFKKIESSNVQFGLKIKSNLAGNLGQAGRVIDAVRYYQEILLVNPEFPQALIGLAENLDYWSLIASYQGTKSLSAIIYQNYKLGIKMANLPPVHQPRISQIFEKYRSQLRKWNMDDSDLEKELIETRKEYDAHSRFVKFCLDNYLMLNEHAVYCKCNGGRKDNLSIGRESAAFINIKVPKLELLLNRIKSEFIFARQLFYYADNDQEIDESVYYDMADGEVIGKKSEALRGAFRTCFGVFDKIAHGIGFFYDLKEKPDERIYFNTFFDKSERWEKIKSISNPHLTALYSIASDFNREDGEFAFYRQWRNALEHNLLILTGDEKADDPLKVFNDPDFVQQVSYKYFREQALHLLQLCRSAIFSFTYCIRMETIEPLPPDGNPTFVITQKALK